MYAISIYAMRKRQRTIASISKNIPQAEIDKAREFFDMGMSAEQTARQKDTPGRDSCQIFWNGWEEELHGNYNLKINERQIKEKEKLRISLQRILFKLEYMLQKIEEYLDSDFEAHKESLRKGEESKGFKVNPRIEHLRLHLLEDIVRVRDAIARIIMEPIIMEKEEEEILKHMEENAERLAGKTKNALDKNNSV